MSNTEWNIERCIAKRNAMPETEVFLEAWSIVAHWSRWILIEVGFKSEGHGYFEQQFWVDLSKEDAWSDRAPEGFISSLV